MNFPGLNNNDKNTLLQAHERHADVQFCGFRLSDIRMPKIPGNNGKRDILKPAGFKQNKPSLLLSTLAINILSLALPIMTLQVYDRILPNPGTGTLPILISGVCLAVVLEAILRLSRAYLIGRAGASYEHFMACAAMKKLLGADLSQIGNYGTGEHLHRMGAVGKLKDFYNGQAFSVLADLAFVPLFFVVIFYIGKGLVLVPTLILGSFIVLSLWRGYRLRAALKLREKSDDLRFNFLIETLEGIHTVKAFALEKFFERRYEALEEDSTFENYKVTQETSSTFNMGAIFSHLMVASVISFGAWAVLQGQLTSGALIATLLLSGRMMQPVQKALGLWARYQDYKIAREHLEELFAIPQIKNAGHKQEEDLWADGQISLDNVSFQHKEATHPFLENINLDLKRGDAILISGGHGAGKSTLLDLMAGIYPSTSGDIVIDGQAINSFSAEQLARHVGYIRTRPLMFRGTIRDNITCFGQIAESQAQEIASLLDVDKDVATLPSGFDTFLNGNNTDSIPPGLKQRIAITRVLAIKPRIILFDNADRALDKDGYAMIYSLLARLKGKATLILISEDHNIRSLADQHFLLANGTLLPTSIMQEQNNVKPYKELRL